MIDYFGRFGGDCVVDECGRNRGGGGEGVTTDDPVAC